MEEPAEVEHRMDLIQKYLAKTLRMEVQVTKVASSYGPEIEAFRAHKIDAASISPFSYILATEKVPIEAIVMRGNPQGGQREYNGVLAVPKNSPIHSVEDMIKHSKDFTISFVDPASASGFLVQNAFLQSRGIEPQRDFKRVVFTNNHLASLMTLKAGKVDVAAVAQKLVDRYKRDGKIAPDEVRVIWVSPDIPNQPVAVRKDLPAAFKEEVRQAFVDMATKDRETWDSLVSKKYAGMVMPGTVYVAANDAMFDGLRQMAHGVKNLSLLEH